MQGLGGLLCLATVAIEALLSVMAAALSGFGLFFRVTFRWGHDDLLRIVMSSIPTYMKETMSHLASISKRQTRGEDAPAPPSYKPFMMNGFHGVSSENPHQCLLKFMFGKASIDLRIVFVVQPHQPMFVFFASVFHAAKASNSPASATSQNVASFKICPSQL